MKLYVLSRSLLISHSFTQFDYPLDFFPAKTGNMWEYFFDDVEYPDTEQLFNIGKLVDSEGNIFLTQSIRQILEQTQDN